MIKAILFDLDGTLIDSEEYYTEGTFEWIQRFGFKGKIEDIYPFIGKTYQVQCEMVSGYINHQMSAEEVRVYNDNFFANEKPMVCSEYAFPEVKDSIIELKKHGYKMAICSSSSKELIAKIIAELGFDQYIDFIQSSDDVENGKPAPDVYLEALKFFNIEPKESIVVEDSYSGILAGKNANIYTVARKDYRYNIDQSLADSYIDGIDELYDLIKEIDYGRCNHN